MLLVARECAVPATGLTPAKAEVAAPALDASPREPGMAGPVGISLAASRGGVSALLIEPSSLPLAGEVAGREEKACAALVLPGVFTPETALAAAGMLAVEARVMSAARVMLPLATAPFPVQVEVVVPEIRMAPALELPVSLVAETEPEVAGPETVDMPALGWAAVALDMPGEPAVPAGETALPESRLAPALELEPAASPAEPVEEPIIAVRVRKLSDEELVAPAALPEVPEIAETAPPSSPDWAPFLVSGGKAIAAPAMFRLAGEPAFGSPLQPAFPASGLLTAYTAEELGEEAAEPAPASIEEPAMVLPVAVAEVAPIEAVPVEPVEAAPPRAVVVPLPVVVEDEHHLAIPAGVQQRTVLEQLLPAKEVFNGLAVSIGVVDFNALVSANGKPAVEAHLEQVQKVLEGLIEGHDMLCRSADDEWLLLFPGETAAQAQERLRGVSERIWDFQLRSLGALSVFFTWGAAEGIDDPLMQPVQRAREEMLQMQRSRRGPLNVSPRNRRRVANG
jgi:GGDEF domain-containing protein